LSSFCDSSGSGGAGSAGAGAESLGGLTGTPIRNPSGKSRSRSSSVAERTLVPRALAIAHSSSSSDCESSSRSAGGVKPLGMSTIDHSSDAWPEGSFQPRKVAPPFLSWNSCRSSSATRSVSAGGANVDPRVRGVFTGRLVDGEAGDLHTVGDVQDPGDHAAILAVLSAGLEAKIVCAVFTTIGAGAGR
jgi:hypothetical protein